MLAAFLDSNKEVLVRTVEPRAAAEEPLGLAAERRARLEAILEELIQALRGGGMNGPTRTPASPRHTAVECRERELIRHGVTELIEQRGEQATFGEGMIVSDWASSADRERLREHDHWLSVLLDGVDDSALIFSTEGRIEYVNRKGASVLHDATAVPPDEIVGKTGAELAAPRELAFGLPPDELVAKARANASDESHHFGRWRDTRFGAVYAPDGTLGAVTVVSRDIQQQKLASTRAQMLSKLSMLVGNVDYEDVAEALAGVPIPELADWCVVNILDGDKISSTFVAQRDPGKSALRDALTREVPGWASHPLWQELLLGGFQLLTEVSDDLRRRLATNEAQYRLMAQVGVQSLMVVPVLSRGRTAGIVTLVYTAESGRRYGRDDSALAEDIAFSAAHVMENARLLKELKSSEARFRVALAGARTAVYEQDRSLRFVWYYNALAPFSLVGKTHEEAFPPEDAARLSRLKEPVLESGERAYGELDVTLAGERRQYRETVDPVRDHAGKIVGVIGAATDITEEKRVQQELRDVLGFRDHMTAILSHDLRNPLSAATVAADALNRRPDLPEDSRQQKLTVIKRATARMTEMIDTLLDFARVHAAGKLPVSPKPIESRLGRPGSDRRGRRRAPGPRHRGRRDRRPSRRVGPGTHGSSSVEPDRQRDGLWRPSDSGPRVCPW